MKIGPIKTRRKTVRQINQGPDKAEAPLRKKRRLKYIAFLPSFITLLNGACGFIAIVIAGRSPVVRWSVPMIRGFSMTSIALAAYLVVLAMIADMLDGRVARLTRTTSSFGGQLDSLSDTISFGITPAFLMIKLPEYHLERLSNEYRRLSMLAGRIIFFSAIIYAMCAVVRLARFNVENDEDESAHMNFSGLPSPAAAGVVVSLVILHQQFFIRSGFEPSRIFAGFELVTVFAFPVITLLSGILMVSRVRYPHLPNQLLRSKKTPPTLLAIFASCILIIWNIQLALAVGFCGFAIFGVVRWIFWTAFRKRPPRPQADTPSA
jgi:CDP-diacylglycerol--serine O-phosphatidyltransferase